MIKNRTYHNMMVVIHKLEKKGWSFDESFKTAKRIFDEFEANPLGLSIQGRIDQILTVEEFEAEMRLAQNNF